AALRAELPAGPILLGHTMNDQAETVLLGLGRGSGPRSMAGMREFDPPWCRPLLAVQRDCTLAVCAELGLDSWQDPHNADPRFTRVRLRTEVLPLLEQVLSGGVAGALARTAGQLREDLDLLEQLGTELRAAATCAPGGEHPPPGVVPAPSELDVAVLARAPVALRRRALRGWLLESGARDLAEPQLRRADELLTDWHGQGAVQLSGGLELSRTHGRLVLGPLG
ncbi:MAG: tRNA lysidine(34) synthetase, partial [Sciscionella sp.]